LGGRLKASSSKLVEGKKHTPLDFFGNHSGIYFLSKSSIVALYSNLFEKLGKSEIKN
jgi:hypothetical protein